MCNNLEEILKELEDTVDWDFFESEFDYSLTDSYGITDVDTYIHWSDTITPLVLDGWWSELFMCILGLEKLFEYWQIVFNGNELLDLGSDRGSDTDLEVRDFCSDFEFDSDSDSVSSLYTYISPHIDNLDSSNDNLDSSNDNLDSKRVILVALVATVGFALSPLGEFLLKFVLVIPNGTALTV